MEAVMKILESAENYLETILILKRRNGSVRSVDIARELGYSKPSVSIAMRNLRENGYVKMTEDGLLSLTTEGAAIAERMYERHTFISDLLISLGVDRQNALEDACRIEHVISEESFSALKKYFTEKKE